MSHLFVYLGLCSADHEARPGTLSLLEVKEDALPRSALLLYPFYKIMMYAK